MRIVIDGKTAVLKNGTSFDMVSENRAFSGADSYTLSIIFPLRGCPENIDIFGHLNRIDVDNSKVRFDCEIFDVDFYSAGTITIVETNEVEVKTQFLEGRSAQNFDTTFDDIYINELDLGEYPEYSLSNNPATYWKGIEAGQESIALPWVINSSGNIQNEVVYVEGDYAYHEDCNGLSFQPYLIIIVKRICNALGYDYDILQWEKCEDLRCLIICNTLPHSWNISQFARALPHWSVTEFFEKLEQFLGGEFDINHKSKFIKFVFTANALKETPPVLIEDVVDDYNSNITSEDESGYVELANVKYKDCDNSVWKFYSCPWFIADNISNRVEYETFEALVAENKMFAKVQRYGRNSNVNKILYAKDIDTHFIIRCVSKEEVETRPTGLIVYDYNCVLQPINVFGPRVIDEDSDNEIELEFVPAWIDETDSSKGKCLFLDFDDYSEEVIDASRPDDTTTLRGENTTLYQPIAMQQLLKGEQTTEKAEYYDCIYVAFWDGTNLNNGKLPSPTIDKVSIYEDWSYIETPYSLRISNGILKQQMYNIDPKQKFNFSFIYNGMPNVRSLFFISGKKYICAKITTTITENGMSQLKKGEFYRILDE